MLVNIRDLLHKAAGTGKRGKLATRIYTCVNLRYRINMRAPKRTERSRCLILDAADAAFRELGFPGTSMEEIARRAGLTRKTVYNLFSSKEEIGLRLVARVEAEAGPVYRARIEADEDVFVLLEDAFLGSARWCLANPSLAKIAFTNPERPSLQPPSGRPTFQQIVRDILVLGQRQGAIRKDDDPDFMSLVLLGIYAQAMLTALSGGPFSEDGIRHLIRIVVEGIGEQSRPARGGPRRPEE